MSNKPNFGKRRRITGDTAGSLFNLSMAISATAPEAMREFAALVSDTLIDGGCDNCDAYQTIQTDPDCPNISHMTIHHDDWCPVLQRTTGAA